MRSRVRAAAPISCPVVPALCPPFPRSAVIPAKAGIQTVADKPAARNQVQITASGSPLWACMGRLTLNSVRLSTCLHSDYRAVIPAKAGIQTFADKPAVAGGTPALPGAQTYPPQTLDGRRLE